MRKFFLVLIIGIVLCSCLNEGDSNFTPIVYISDFFYSDSISTDTFALHWNEEGIRQVDTLQVGDTVQFAVQFDAVGNNLISAQLFWDTAAMSVFVPSYTDLTQVLLATSDSALCKFDLPLGYNRLGIPMYCLPKREGETKIKFHIETDSKYSPLDEELKCIVKQAPQK